MHSAISGLTLNGAPGAGEQVPRAWARPVSAPNHASYLAAIAIRGSESTLITIIRGGLESLQTARHRGYWSIG